MLIYYENNFFQKLVQNLFANIVNNYLFLIVLIDGLILLKNFKNFSKTI